MSQMIILGLTNGRTRRERLTSQLFYILLLLIKNYIGAKKNSKLGPGQTVNVWRPNTIKHCLVTKRFTVWTPYLVLFDRVRSCFVVFDKI